MLHLLPQMRLWTSQLVMITRRAPRLSRGPTQGLVPEPARGPARGPAQDLISRVLKPPAVLRISAHEKGRYLHWALHSFRELQLQGFTPNVIVHSTAISACEKG